jgi:prepilin signal peptidase PulO-like enzyme (type II secretory pathway)
VANCLSEALGALLVTLVKDYELTVIYVMWRCYMKGKLSVLTTIGILVYVIYSLVDRFVIEIPDIVAIPVMMLGIVLILAGIVKTPKDNATK